MRRGAGLRGLRAVQREGVAGRVAVDPVLAVRWAGSGSWPVFGLIGCGSRGQSAPSFRCEAGHAR